VTPDRGTPKAVEPQNDPFADDPRPPTAAKAKEVDPFAVDAASDQPEGTVPSGKLIGILGRALRQAAPLPSLEGLRQQLPPLPVPGAAGQPPNAAGGFGAEPGAFPNAESDPFGEGASETEDANGSREEPAPTDAPEEDPFGGF
jgi:hypothetical protein